MVIYKVSFFVSIKYSTSLSRSIYLFWLTTFSKSEHNLVDRIVTFMGYCFHEFLIKSKLPRKYFYGTWFCKCFNRTVYNQVFKLDVYMDTICMRDFLYTEEDTWISLVMKRHSFNTTCFLDRKIHTFATCYLQHDAKQGEGGGFKVMVFNTTFNKISVIW